MVVYKFGGASVRDASGIRNLREIVLSEKEELVIVVSAFGKTTNALEKVLRSWISGDGKYSGLLEEVFRYHMDVLSQLSYASEQTGNIMNKTFDRLKEYLSCPYEGNYDFEYDQVVSFGEIWSTIIISGYLNNSGVKVKWVDIRENLITNDRFRDANILWDESSVRIKSSFNFNSDRIFLTQGFIGATLTGKTTTLGREGSDYTAAILGNILDASRVVFWKDVPGILNADPKWLPDVTRLDEISYKEAVEMTFSGAKIIHPKTIKPLHNKNIPLNVKSFLHPDDPGTIIKADANQERIIPVFIKKEDQILISILPKDFSFVMGDNLGRVFHAFLVHGIKVNLVQASAVSINVCVDDERVKVNNLIEDLKKDFKAIYNDDVEMLSIRHYTPGSIELISGGREILLEQKTRRIVRFVMKKL
ncbi:MAG TPA: aspartate kinase [Bacteroidales bacterium]|nr:aspartate kinase [Bacteroidales bacterium]